MNMNYLEQNLKELGLEIANQTRFDDFIKSFNGGLPAFLELLNIKNKVINRRVDYNYYENEIISYLKTIQKELSSDKDLKNSKDYLKEQYNVIIKNIINNNIIGLKIEKAKELSEDLTNKLINLDIRISEVEKDETIDESERISKLVNLNKEKDELQNKYFDALNVIENEKSIREKMQNRDFNGLIDSLLRDIEDLNTVIGKLDVDVNVKKRIGAVGSLFTDRLKELKVNKKKAVAEYEDLLKKASLIKSENRVLFGEVIDTNSNEIIRNAKGQMYNEYEDVDYEEVKEEVNSNYDGLDDINIEENVIREEQNGINSLVGSNVVYSGKILLDDANIHDGIPVGKAFKVISVSKDENENDQFELEGLPGVHSVLYFETEEVWNNYLNEIKEHKVSSVINRELEKIDVCINAIVGILDKENILDSVKKYGVNTVIEKTDKISKKYLPIFKKIMEILDQREVNNLEQRYADYNPAEPLINEEEFSREFEEITSHMKR